ncbi:MAG TPA: rhamnulokinase family protein [Chthoniobacteraceae bacterium]|jgi:rhamnulokinase|nr:rhamnulokinase family protein [Chthoniobacteraceae bacterium]
MAEQCFLGIDLGGESGRVMAGLWNGERMRLEEVHRFPNGALALGDSLRWDLLRLWSEIESGLTIAAQRFGDSIVSVGADTWGVDFVLLSKSGELLGQPRHYRDPRNLIAVESMLQRVSREEIWAASGIQFMPINTLPQLVAMREHNPELLDAADCFLMIPDFLHWCLCGAKAVELTNATTTQFFHPTQRRWSHELLAKLGLPTAMLPEVVQPGTDLGAVTTAVANRTGLRGVRTIAPATHDTGSAVVAVPTQRTGQANWAYLSSGTWSLLGLELPQPIVSPRALELNVTNEGGVDGTYRLLKNIMGLWLVQQCRRAFEKRGGTADYAELVRLAEAAPAFRSLVDPDDPRFLSPADMPAAIADACRETGQPVPESEGQFVRCALESLALKYAKVLGWLEELSGRRVEVIHVVGGGGRNALLNQFTANATGRTVLTGPVEATVIGNLLVQARAAGEIGSLAEIRRISGASAEMQEFRPLQIAAWQEAAERFARLQP